MHSSGPIRAWRAPVRRPERCLRGRRAVTNGLLAKILAFLIFAGCARIRTAAEEAKRDQRPARGHLTVNRPFGEVWCIFDRDDHRMLDQVVASASTTSGMAAAVS